MRKYILSVGLIAIGVFSFIFNYINRQATTYSETSFAIQAKEFDKNFGHFANSTQENLETISLHFEDTLVVKDTLGLRNYLLNTINNNPRLISIGVFQGSFKAIARKEGASNIFAVDSLKGLDVVRWQRFEKGKQISQWYESFEFSVESNEWFKELTEQTDRIKWYVRSVEHVKNQVRSSETMFYAGFSYSAMNTPTILLFEYSKEQMLSELNIANSTLSPLLLFRSTDGEEMYFNSRKDSLEGIDKPISIDSIKPALLNHFQRFDNVEQGTFNFKYDQQTYWTAFKRFPASYGIDYYMFTIPDSSLKMEGAHYAKGYRFWLPLIVVLLGILLLVVKKRFFYLPNRMAMPSLKSILEEDESRYLEFKSSMRWDYRQEKVNPVLEKVILKTIAAFGNTDGGILLIGVDDDKNIVGLEKDFQTLKKSNADFYEVHLRNILHKHMGVKYVSKYIRTQFETVSGKTIAKIKVLHASEPMILKLKNKNGIEEEKFYVRSGNSSHEITSMSEINDYINKKFK